MILDPSTIELLRSASADFRRHAMIHRGSGNLKAAKAAQESADELERAVAFHHELIEGMATGAFSDGV